MNYIQIEGNFVAYWCHCLDVWIFLWETSSSQIESMDEMVVWVFTCIIRATRPKAASICLAVHAQTAILVELGIEAFPENTTSSAALLILSLI